MLDLIWAGKQSLCPSSDWDAVRTITGRKGKKGKFSHFIICKNMGEAEKKPPTRGQTGINL